MFHNIEWKPTRLDSLYYDTYYSIPRNHHGYKGILSEPYPDRTQLYQSADPNFWALQNLTHPNATTRRAVTPLINLAHFRPDVFRDTLKDSSAMINHIIPHHGQSLSSLPSGFPMGFGRQQPQRPDNPSRFNTANPAEIAALGHQSVLGGTPYLSQPGYLRGEHSAIAVPRGSSTLDFIHSFNTNIGTHQSMPTPRVLFSFELGPNYSPLWSVPQTEQSFGGENPQIRLKTGYPIEPPTPLPATTIGRAAAATDYKRGGFAKRPIKRFFRR